MKTKDILDTVLATVSATSPVTIGLVGLVIFSLSLILHGLYCLTLHPLSKIPGPWLPAASTLWIRWHRWHGRLSFTADDLLSKHGPVIRIAPNMVLINDLQTVQSLFTRQDLDTAPKSIRALRIGGHDWTVTYPQNPIARPRRRPVMTATTTKAMRHWHPTFQSNIMQMITNLDASRGKNSEDIVYHLRIATLLNSLVVISGPQTKIEPGDFPHTVGEYNFLVVWRLCLPEWLFTWLKASPFREAAFRIRSSDYLFHLGQKAVEEAENSAESDAVSTVYELLEKTIGREQFRGSTAEASAELAGQILAATETTSSALAFIFYYIAGAPALGEAIYEEVQSAENLDGLENLKVLNACITEGLRFRPPVALTGSRVVPAGGIDVLGYYLPAGTVVTTQSLSLSRQRPDLFPNYDEFDPSRWLVDDPKLVAERRKCLAPFGIGSRRCPGGNMATYQMRMILAAVIRAFRLSVAPETTPLSMAPFEANGFRSRHDACRLVFTPRDLRPQPGPRGCECGEQCDCIECHCVHYDSH